MKKLKDFVFCDGVLSSRTVFYLVAVGSSARDAAAWRFVRKTARGQNYFIGDHGLSSQAFIERCAVSIYGGVSAGRAVSLLRRVLVPVTWLAAFLRSYPPALLNSVKISVPENHVKWK